MISLFILSLYYETKFGLFIFAAIVAILVLALYLLTGGFIFKYIKKIKSKDTQQFLYGFHLITSLLLALILPNNFLNNFNYFHNLFDKNTLWIPASMIGIFFILLIIIGIILNIVCNILFKKKGIE